MYAVFMLFMMMFMCAADDAVTEAQPDLNNTLRWTTASESNNFGYDVYRSLAQDGPFERLNEEPIPGAGTTDLPSQYEYIDTAIEPNTIYWYYIESISLTGERKRFTPVYSSQPKFAR